MNNAAFTARTTDGVSTGYELESDSCVVFVHGDSVMGGAEVHVEAATANTSEEFAPLSYIGVITGATAVTVTLKTGMFVRARVARAGVSTSVNVDVVT